MSCGPHRLTNWPPLLRKRVPLPCMHGSMFKTRLIKRLCCTPNFDSLFIRERASEHLCCVFLWKSTSNYTACDTVETTIVETFRN
jgi:hypothetical protein